MNDIYTDGTYIAKNPTWHEEDAPFKARHILGILEKNHIEFSRIAEVGCGTGGVLRNLRDMMLGPSNITWCGFDISGEAISIAQENPDSSGIRFEQKDVSSLDDNFSDVLLVIDVFEHVPDYFRFLELCRKKARYKIYHIPLDFHVSSALRESYINSRYSVGHLHYFGEKTAVATLVDTGHKIIDVDLTPGAIDLFMHHPSVKRAIANIPRMIMGVFSRSLSARFFGGYSLLVLAE